MSQLELWSAMWREARPDPMRRVDLAAAWDAAVDQLEEESGPMAAHDLEAVADLAIQLYTHQQAS